MSELSGWNILDTCRSKTCDCVNLAGSTFVTILGTDCDLNENYPLVIQIYENYTFAARLRLRETDTINVFQAVFGTWKCCNGIWAGVAIAGNATPLTNCNEGVGDHYIRISFQICPKSNTIRWRRIYFVADEDACLSDKEPGTVTFVTPVFERKLQRIVNPCQVTDHDLKLPPSVAPQ